MLKGCDVSRHQGTINWNALKNDVQFAIIRSSYGDGYADTQYTRNKNEARRVGLPIGFYHYAYPTFNTPEKEAAWFLKVNSDLQPGEMLVLDFEEKYPDPVGWSKRFLDYIANNLGGYKALIYLNEYLTNSYNWSVIEKANHGLWIAKYGANNGQVPSVEPNSGAWVFAAMWQYTSQGSAGGIKPLDLNQFFGDVNAFKRYGYKPSNLPAPTPVPQPPNNPPMNENVEVFKNIYICLFANWPDEVEVKKYEESGRLPYTYCQEVFLYPERQESATKIDNLNKRIKELEEAGGGIDTATPKQLAQAFVDKFFKE